MAHNDAYGIEETYAKLADEMEQNHNGIPYTENSTSTYLQELSDLERQILETHSPDLKDDLDAYEDAIDAFNFTKDALRSYLAGLADELAEFGVDKGRKSPAVREVRDLPGVRTHSYLATLPRSHPEAFLTFSDDAGTRLKTALWDDARNVVESMNKTIGTSDDDKQERQARAYREVISKIDRTYDGLFEYFEDLVAEDDTFREILEERIEANENIAAYAQELEPKLRERVDETVDDLYSPSIGTKIQRKLSSLLG